MPYRGNIIKCLVLVGGMAYSSTESPVCLRSFPRTVLRFRSHSRTKFWTSKETSQDKNDRLPPTAAAST